jgi:hypothetical protein
MSGCTKRVRWIGRERKRCKSSVLSESKTNEKRSKIVRVHWCARAPAADPSQVHRASGGHTGKIKRETAGLEDSPGTTWKMREFSVPRRIDVFERLC